MTSDLLSPTTVPASRYTVQHDAHPARPEPTHTVHLCAPDDYRADLAVCWMDGLRARLTGDPDGPLPWLTGRVAAGDSWSEWCEPARMGEPSAVHVDVIAPDAATAYRLGRMLATALLPGDHDARATMTVTTLDWSVEAHTAAALDTVFGLLADAGYCDPCGTDHAPGQHPGW